VSNFNRISSESNEQRRRDHIINLTHFLTCMIGPQCCVLHSGDCNITGPSVCVQCSDLQTLSDIILLPLIGNQSSNHSDKCTHIHNSIHIRIQMLFIVNVHKGFSQLMCRGKCFSEGNDLSSVHVNQNQKSL